MGNRIVWFTGLSGAGKTTIAMAAADRFGCEVLDGDTIRDFFATRTSPGKAVRGTSSV